MSERDEAETKTQEGAPAVVHLWALPTTWFGWGVGVLCGAGFAGGTPWYRPGLIAFSGLCVAVGMLVHMRKR